MCGRWWWENRYNGKEELEDVGLYDDGARMYDPAIARWTSIDPLAEDYNSYLPYNYVLGDPIGFIILKVKDWVL